MLIEPGFLHHLERVARPLAALSLIAAKQFLRLHHHCDIVQRDIGLEFFWR
jgi:hypothetical protein